jgi:tetratricopeptide (TPR) repeat protein
MPNEETTLAGWLEARLKLTNRYVIALIAAVAFSVYANALRVPFLFDDAPVITRNRLFRDLSLENVERVVASHPLRAIPNLSFYLNYQLEGTRSNVTFHAVNVALHAANAVLLFVLLETLLAVPKPRRGEAPPTLGRWIALGATLLWLVHPIQTMAVTYITQRYALFAATGIFGAVLCYARLRRRMEAGTAWLPARRRGSFALYAGVWAFGVLGCLSKENAAIIPVLLPLVELLCFTRTAPENARPSLAVELLGDRGARFLLASSLAPGLLAALLYRYEVVGTLEDVIPASTPTFPDRMSYFRTEWVVLLKYLKLWVWPADLSIEQAFPCLEWSNPEHRTHMLLALAGHALIATLGVIWYRSGRRFLALSVAWYYLSQAVESSFLPILDPMVEHRMYVPSSFLAAGLAWALGRAAEGVWPTQPRWAVALVASWVALVAASGIGTHLRNESWGTPQDSAAIWRDTIAKRPDCARAYSSLGMEYLYAGRFQEAIAPIESALALGPLHVEGWNNLAKAYLGVADTLPDPTPLLAWAQAALLRGIEVNEVAPSPSVPLCWNNLGLTHLKLATRSDREAHLLEATRAFSEAVKLDPDYDSARLCLGESLIERAEGTPPGEERKLLAGEAARVLRAGSAASRPQGELHSAFLERIGVAESEARGNSGASPPRKVR